LRAVAHRIYSNPPSHGGQAIATVLADPNLFTDARNEVETIRKRIADMRQKVYDRLQKAAQEYDSSYFIKQRGMFCYTGLTLQQLETLRQKYGVYIIDSGRISMPGLNDDNVDYVVPSLVAVLSDPELQ